MMKLHCTILGLATTALLACPAQGDQYGDVILAADPVAFWRINDTGNGAVTAVDAASDAGSPQAGSQDGTYNNFTDGWIGGFDGPRPPEFGGFASDNLTTRFGGYNDYIGVSDTAALDITGELTLEAWIYGLNPNWDTEGNDDDADGIVSKYSSGGRSYQLNVTDDGELGFMISDDGSSSGSHLQVLQATDIDLGTPGDQVLSTGHWYHVAAVFDPGTSMTLYVDGQPVTNLTSGVLGSIYASSTDVWIGTQFSNGAQVNRRFWNGYLDDVAIYDRALSSSEVLQHYQAATITPPFGTVVSIR